MLHLVISKEATSTISVSKVKVGPERKFHFYKIIIEDIQCCLMPFIQQTLKSVVLISLINHRAN